MTVNDQHTVMAEHLLAEARHVVSDLESMLVVLRAGPSPKRDPDAKPLTEALSSLMRAIVTAHVHSDMMERKLRYSRGRRGLPPADPTDG